MSDVLRIGDALVEQGIITREQLAEVLAESGGGVSGPLGERIAARFHLPARLLDEVNVRHVLLPRFRKLLLGRLLSISRTDKFAKGMDVRTFVVGISTRPITVEVRVVARRRYEIRDDAFEDALTDRGFVTNMDVQVELRTARGQAISGRISLRHDGLENTMSILDDDKHIRESVYYGLRTAFRSGG